MTINQADHIADNRRRQSLMAAGGLLGALAASSCCILPLALLGLRVSGAWIGNFTRLCPLPAVLHRRDGRVPRVQLQQAGGQYLRRSPRVVLAAGMIAGLPASYFCVRAFSETDFTEDLKKFDVPTLILHGDDDQIVPYADAVLLSAKLIKSSKLK